MWLCYVIVLIPDIKLYTVELGCFCLSGYFLPHFQCMMLIMQFMCAYLIRFLPRRFFSLLTIYIYAWILCNFAPFCIISRASMLVYRNFPSGLLLIAIFPFFRASKTGKVHDFDCTKFIQTLDFSLRCRLSQCVKNFLLLN